MSAPIPDQLPAEIRAGDTLIFTRSHVDYPASAGWALAFKLVNASVTPISFSASASGDDYSVTVAAATTGTWQAGRYTWVETATLSGVRKTLGSGEVLLLADLAALAASYDGRTFARKMLEAIEAALVSAATASQLDLIDVTFAGRGQKRDRATLIAARDRYKREVQSEERAAGIKPGRGRVLLRM